MRSLILAAMMAIAPAAAMAEANWPQFRGPGSTGVVEDNLNLPDSWSATENVLWKTDVPGLGWASPIVWGNKVFLTSVVKEGAEEEIKKGLYFRGERPDPPTEPHRWMTYCFDLETGKQLWEAEAHKGVPPKGKHLKNTYASETPATDGERVYAYFGNLGIFAYDMDGELVWKKTFDPVKTRYEWGTAASPVVHEGRVYLVNDNDEKSWLIALDAKTGEQLWRADREEKSNWATPYVWKNELRTEIVTPGTQKVRSYGTDGKLLWEFKGMSNIAIPTPFSKFGLLFVSSGYVGDKFRPVYAIKPGASGDISLKEGEAKNEFIVWHDPVGGPYNPSPLIYGDVYYTLMDRGFFTAHDAKTGAVIYDKKRIDPAAGAFTSSPWAYNGKIFVLSEDGITYVIKAGPEFEVIGKNDLGELTLATPAIAGDSLLIRTAGKLYKIGAKKAQTVN